jgi:hypothetical protein
VAEVVYNRGKYLLARQHVQAIAWRATLIIGTTTGTLDPDLNTVADLDAVSGVSIHTERLTPASVVYTENDTNDRLEIDCANLTFAAAPGVTAVGLVFYHEQAAADATRELISMHNTGFPVPVDGGLVVTVTDFLRNS